MDFEQFTGDLTGLTRMAEASQARLADLTSQAKTLRERLQKLLADAEQQEPPGQMSPQDA